MRIVLTGSSGRVGRAIYGALAREHEVIGIDRSAFSTTALVGDLTDESLLRPLLEGADAVIHSAALHAPHVGLIPDEEFRRINVEGTRRLAEAAREAGVRRFVFTSTTALYGHAVVAGGCTWLDEDTVPQPRSVYHRTKLEAEGVLAGFAAPAFDVRVLRMSRSFPEQADIMAAYRLHRGIDVRDVADVHCLALENEGPSFQLCIVSCSTPFKPEDRTRLAEDAASVIRLRAPSLAEHFDRRGWHLPRTIDRVYDAKLAEQQLGWRSRFDWSEVVSQFDRRSLEVLPPSAWVASMAE